jgi:hypothetical protein
VRLVTPAIDIGLELLGLGLLLGTICLGLGATLMPEPRERVVITGIKCECRM